MLKKIVFMLTGLLLLFTTLSVGIICLQLFVLNSVSRPLTHGEITALRSIFQEDLNYSKITIKTARLPPLMAAYVLGNTIVYREQYHLDDFSKDYMKTAMLVHEAGHVWANQKKGLTSSVNAVMEHIIYGQNVYRYEPLKKTGSGSANLSLDDFRYEQQCRILADYYIKRHFGYNTAELDQIIYRSIKRID